MIKKEAIASFLLYINLFSCYLLKWEINIFIILISFFYVIHSKVAYHQITFLPFVFILPVGLTGLLNNDLVEGLKDVVSFCLPILYLFFGIFIARWIPLKKYLEIIFYASIILAVVFLFKYAGATATSVRDLKGETGVASYLTILSFSIFLMSKFARSQINQNILKIGLIFLGAVSILTVSRTFLMVFIVMFFSLTGFFNLTKHSFLKISVLSLILIASLFLVNSIDSSDRSTFLGKIATSINEVSVKQYSNMQEINSNWRGFESFKGLESYSKGNTFQLIFGHGFGKTADLGFYMPLAESNFREIGKFHNGYVTILLKTGVVGILLYVFAFFKIIKINSMKNSGTDQINKFLKQVIIGLSLTFLVTTFVIAGWLNKTALVPMIISLGYFVSLQIKYENTNETASY